MPDRLDRVTVALNRGDVFLSWASRGVLLERLRDVEERRLIRFSFTSVDGSLPVKLTPAQCADIIVVLDEWPDTLPQDLLEFRDALIADEHGTR